MSTLKVTHLQNENGSGPAMSVAVGGGVTFAGISTFHTGLNVNDGNIGIGTDNPTSKLTINGTSGAADNSSNIRFALSSSTEGLYGVANSGGNLVTGSALGDTVIRSDGHNILFSVDSGTSITTRITSNGNVGINNTNPDQRLKINGNIEVNAYDDAGGSGGYNTSSGLIIGNAYDAGKTGLTDDRNAIIWQERGLDLDIATNNTFRMKITYDGKVGINTTTPDERLEVGDGTVSGALKVSGQSSSVTSDGFTVDWESSTDSTRLFSEPQSGGNSQFKIYTTSSGTRSLAATINSSGNLVFPNGKGIDFSATAGSGMETGGGVLDDYEEGTWTPTSETGTINSTSATYTKIGNIVHLNVYIDQWSNITSDAVVQIQGLPYAGENTDGNIGSVMYRYIDDTDGIGGDMAVFMAGGTSLRFYFQNSDGDSNYSALKHKDINGTTSSFRVQMTYRVA